MSQDLKTPPMFSRLRSGACANCATPLMPAQLFCAQCGQKVLSERLSLNEIGHDLMHALLHVDRSILSMIRLLLTRPGEVAKQYAGGQRKRYFGPFAFLAIMVGLASVMIAASGFSVFVSDGGQPNAVAQFLQRHVNLIILIQVPVLGAICFVFFRGSRFYYAEHLVLVAYASGMRSLYLTVVALPVWYAFRPVQAALPLTYLYFLIWAAYFGLAASQFYAGHRAWLWVKGIVAALLAQVATTFFVSAATYVYFEFLAN